MDSHGFSVRLQTIQELTQRILEALEQADMNAVEEWVCLREAQLKALLEGLSGNDLDPVLEKGLREILQHDARVMASMQALQHRLQEEMNQVRVAGRHLRRFSLSGSSVRPRYLDRYL